MDINQLESNLKQNKDKLILLEKLLLESIEKDKNVITQSIEITSELIRVLESRIDRFNNVDNTN